MLLHNASAQCNAFSGNIIGYTRYVNMKPEFTKMAIAVNVVAVRRRQ